MNFIFVIIIIIYFFAAFICVLSERFLLNLLFPSNPNYFDMSFKIMQKKHIYPRCFFLLFFKTTKTEQEKKKFLLIMGNILAKKGKILCCVFFSLHKILKWDYYLISINIKTNAFWRLVVSFMINNKAWLELTFKIFVFRFQTYLCKKRIFLKIFANSGKKKKHFLFIILGKD